MSFLSVSVIFNNLPMLCVFFLKILQKKKVRYENERQSMIMWKAFFEVKELQLRNGHAMAISYFFRLLVRVVSELAKSETSKS